MVWETGKKSRARLKIIPSANVLMSDGFRRCSLGEEPNDRKLSSPYHRRSYHIIQNDPNQDMGADHR